MEETTATNFSQLRILLVDNFDSFTYNLVAYLRQLGANVTVVRNDIPPSESIEELYHGVVLSPGPGTPSEAGYLLSYLKFNLPLLGVCLGHQALAMHFGGQIVKAIKPMHGKLSIIRRVDDPIFEGIPEEFKVVRYHSLLAETLGRDLHILATTHAGEIMAMKHISHPYYGVQYHPEAILTEYGYQLMGNWLNIVLRLQTIERWKH